MLIPDQGLGIDLGKTDRVHDLRATINHGCTADGWWDLPFSYYDRGWIAGLEKPRLGAVHYHNQNMLHCDLFDFLNS